MKGFSVLLCLCIETRRHRSAAFVRPPKSIAHTGSLYPVQTLRTQYRTFIVHDAVGSTSETEDEPRKTSRLLVGVGDRDLDPLIRRKLLLLLSTPSSLSNDSSEESSDTDDDENNVHNSDAKNLRVKLLLQANKGLQAWRYSLMRGRLPVVQDFDETPLWPTEPLFSKVSQTMASLELQRLVLRHNELVNSVLLSLLTVVLEFQLAIDRGRTVEKETEEFDKFEYDLDEEDQIKDEIPTTFEELSDEELGALADELVSSGIMDEWGKIAGGITALDRLFGADHGLLLKDDETLGFGTWDGVWQHTGWKTLTQLQQEQIASMTELKQLLNQIGRRPTAHQSDAVHRFAPRKIDPEGGLGAQMDIQRRESVTGLALSGSLTEMVPSEAVLLKGSPSLRRLFQAKRVESKLLSYQMSGWYDTESSPQPESRHLRNMPSAPGGPIIVCLDTSWSMSGMRETLSKAVVVACVTAAHRQKRDCQVVAFSSANGIIETGLLRGDADGVRRLLDFLSHSFGGGTDVTGALKHAMNTLGSSDEMAAADLLLVTDGEIPDPPVPSDMMNDLDRLKRRTGMQIHGLLVGKRESVPLSKLCTKTYDFLLGYDSLAVAALDAKGYTGRRTLNTALKIFHAQSPRSTSRSSRFLWQQGKLFRSKFQTMGDCFRGGPPGLWSIARDFDAITLKKKGAKRGRFDDDEDDLWEMDYTEGRKTRPGNENAVQPNDGFNDKVDEALGRLKMIVEKNISQKKRSKDDLEVEKNSDYSCWKYRGELLSAIERISDNLVEREEESRLVVLGLISQEHVLLLGPPGTGKSVLGRRLSKLCGGNFFQRLLTRFTTPEEIFGPLSLRALENDEYRRCTEGFLPTASVAFLDEIFKANSAILNTLLTILNERQFDNGAGKRETCKIRCVVGASNEMPETDELDALYDRFLLRKEVLPVSDEGIMRILKLPIPGVSDCDSVDQTGIEDDACDMVFTQGLDEVVNKLSIAAGQVSMSEDACILVRDLRNFMKDDLNVEVSDRRLVKTARLLKICAASHGRSRVDPLDCLLLQHVTWRLPDQRTAVRDWLWENITPGGNTSTTSQFRLLLDNLRREALAVVRKTSGDVTGMTGALESDLSVLRDLVSEITEIKSILQDRCMAMHRHIEILRRATDHLWLSPDEAMAAQQVLEPKAETRLQEIERALMDAQCLELVLKEESRVENELRLSVMEMLWEEGQETDVKFSDNELNMGMREAKAKFDLETFRKWKRARKKA